MYNIDINKIIDEVIKEMEYGKVDADIILFMKLHTKNNSHFEITPVLNLDNKELLYSKITEYVLLFKNASVLLSTDEKEGYIKRLIALLFADMSINDFENPILYVRRKIDFVNNRLLEDKNIKFPFFESEIVVKVKPYGKETPYCYSSTIVDEYNCYILPTSYILPTISYGISGDICYIYAIQDYNKHESTPYHNKIKRKLYKLNSGVYENESLEYKDYKEGNSSYYPENISDVPPSFILILTIFLNEIYKKGITKVKVVPYLPIRYEGKIKTLARYVLKESRKKGLSSEETRKMYMELIDKQRYIQSNITEKFIRTFYRVAYHFNNVKITSLPMELDDCLNIKLTEFEYGNNDILNEVIKESNKNLSK